MSVAIHLSKIKSLSPKDALCQVQLKLAKWFWGRRFKFRWCIFAISKISPLRKERDPTYEEKLNPPYPRMLCATLKLVKRFWRRRLKCEKFTDGRTTGDQKITWAFRLGELKIIERKGKKSLDTNNSWVNGIQVCLNEGQHFFSDKSNFEPPCLYDIKAFPVFCLEMF